MSVRAISWALHIPKKLDPTARLVLTYLADRVDDDGRRAWPSQATIATDLEITGRTVRRHLQTLEDAGLIVRGDQRWVAHLPADRRPVVWDLALPGAGGLRLLPGGNQGSPDAPTADLQDVQTAGHQRPLAAVDGGTPVTDRPDTHVPPHADDDLDGRTSVTTRADTSDQTAGHPWHDDRTPASAKSSLNHPETHENHPAGTRDATRPDAAPSSPLTATANTQSAQTPTAAAGVAGLRAAVGGRR